MIEVSGRQIPETLDEVLSPKHTVLLICDMQKWFCNPESGATYTLGPKPANQSEAIENNVTLLSEARKTGVKVMYTEYTTLPDGLSTSDFALYRQGKSQESRKGAEHTIPGTLGWEIIDELKPLKNELVVLKNRRNAFIGSNLHNIMRINGVRTVIPIGRTLEWGIWANAWMAAELDYFVVLPKDAVMGRNPTHMQECLHWFERETIVTDMEHVLSAWRK